MTNVKTSKDFTLYLEIRQVSHGTFRVNEMVGKYYITWDGLYASVLDAFMAIMATFPDQPRIGIVFGVSYPGWKNPGETKRWFIANAAAEGKEPTR